MTIQLAEDVPSQRVLVVGPSPLSSDIGGGGVDTHIRNLARLSLPASITFYDPGSLNGDINRALPGALFGALKVGSAATKARASQVWINTSIYPTPFIKLLLILLGLRTTSVKIVRVFLHGGRFEKIQYLRNRTIRSVCSRVLCRATSFHLLSREQGNGFSSVFPNLAWELFSNFLPEVGLLPPVRRESKVFLFVGRLIPEKGVRDILLAAETLLRAQCHPGQWQVWFAGDGPELATLRAKASQVPAGTIRALGPLTREELERVYQSAFALLLPSYGEGFPYVVIEAMRAGLPLICSATGALSDVVVQHQNGLLVGPGDVDGLARAMRTLMDNDPVVERMGANNSQLFLDRLSRCSAQEYYSSLLCSR